MADDRSDDVNPPANRSIADLGRDDAALDQLAATLSDEQRALVGRSLRSAGDAAGAAAEALSRAASQRRAEPAASPVPGVWA